MKDLPTDEWFDERKKEADKEKCVYNGLNLFAIWMQQCNVADKPCPPHIDIRIWNGFHSYLYAWGRLPKAEKKYWDDAAKRLGW